MFKSKKLLQIEKNIEVLNNDVKNTKQELINLNNEFNRLTGKLLNEVDTKLIEFHKQIADKYFDTLEKIFRFNKEISLINTLAQQVGEKDIAQLKATLLQPILESRWAENKRNIGQAIQNSGEWVIEERKRLHEQYIQMEKQDKPLNDLLAIKNQILAFDRIIEKVKK